MPRGLGRPGFALGDLGLLRVLISGRVSDRTGSRETCSCAETQTCANCVQVQGSGRVVLGGLLAGGPANWFQREDAGRSLRQRTFANLCGPSPLQDGPALSNRFGSAPVKGRWWGGRRLLALAAGQLEGSSRFLLFLSPLALCRTATAYTTGRS